MQNKDDNICDLCRCKGTYRQQFLRFFYQLQVDMLLGSFAGSDLSMFDR